MRLGSRNVEVSQIVGRWLAAAAVAVLLVTCAAPAASGPTASGPAASGPAATASPKPTGPTEKNPVTVRIALVGSSLTQSSTYVGIEQGIFLRHGIDLKVAPFAGVADAVKALQAGQAEIAPSTWVAIAPAVDQGVPLQILIPNIGRPDVANWDRSVSIVVRPNLDKVTTVADLKGLKIASSFGGGTDQWLRANLAKAGLKDSDVQLINAPLANMPALMQSGGADAAGMSEPWGAIALAQVQKSRELARGGGIIDVRTFIVGVKSWIAANQAVAEAYVAGQAEAMQYVRQHPGDAAVAVSRYVSGVDLAILVASLKYHDFDPRWSDAIVKGLEDNSKVLVDQKTIKQAPKMADVLSGFVLTYQKDYPQYFTDVAAK